METHTCMAQPIQPMQTSNDPPMMDVMTLYDKIDMDFAHYCIITVELNGEQDPVEISVYAIVFTNRLCKYREQKDGGGKSTS